MYPGDKFWSVITRLKIKLCFCNIIKACKHVDVLFLVNNFERDDKNIWN